MSELSVTDLNEVFTALSHDKRRDILHGLSFRPATISQLATEYSLSLPLIHKHLRVLENAHLIHRRKAGRTNFVALNKKTLGLAQNWIMQYRTDWGNEQESLENYIASWGQQP